MTKLASRSRVHQAARRKARPTVGSPGVLERAAHTITDLTGSAWAFGMAAGVVVVWVASGPLFGYSDTWQLVINTGTTIVTFLMVFLIQRSQNKESRAVQLKLNEIVAALEGASNRLIDVESLSEQDLAILHQHFMHLGELAAGEADPSRSHSVEEAERRHRRKQAST
jgi:low affinity Fe/Cu permease